MKGRRMKTLLVGLMAILLSGCGAGFFSAKTEASYEITDTGKKITYVSTKEQQGLDVDIKEENGKVKELKIHVDKATTVESAIAAAMQSQVLLMESLKDLVGLAMKASAVVPK
jgi:hypothetical protein